MPNFNDRRLARPEGVARTYQVVPWAIELREAPDLNARIGTQVLSGEVVDTFETAHDFVQVRCRRDHYVGWAEQWLLDPKVAQPTHKVTALRTLGYVKPDQKARAETAYCLGAGLVATGARHGPWIEFERAGWVYERHVSKPATLEEDPAAVAERFLEAPYLWGGRTCLGVDCSGLVQQAFEACGVLLPRDSDMQAAWAGEPVTDWQAPGALQRGDLIFREGHDGILTAPGELLHANAWHMAVARESLANAIERIRPAAGAITGVRRVPIEDLRGDVPAWKAASA